MLTIGAPARYPAPHPVTVMPIADGKVAGVAILATTVGISEKKAPDETRWRGQSRKLKGSLGERS